jgi:hypothetical protein
MGLNIYLGQRGIFLNISLRDFGLNIQEHRNITLYSILSLISDKEGPKKVNVVFR